MSLIECPECSRKVSDKAKACPDCAYPITQTWEEENEEENDEVQTIEKTSKALKIKIVQATCMFFGGWIVVFFGAVNDSTFWEIAGGLTIVFGIARYFSTRFEIWWHHD